MTNNKRNLNLTSMLLMLACLCMLCWMPLLAQTGDGGTESLIHEAGIGSKAYGLGRAYVALANDPTGVFWNPAGLEYAPQVSFSLFHSPLILDGTSLDFLGFLYPTLNFGSIGIGLTRIGVNDIQYTDENNILGTNGADFTYSEIYIAYAKKLPFSITPGVTFKVQRQSFSENNIDGSAFGLDFGLLYRPDFENALMRNLSIGVHYLNAIQPQVKAGPNPEDVATKLTFGLMKTIPVGVGGKMNVLFDVAQWEVSGTSLHMGVEYGFRDFGTLRAGFDRNAPTFGAGIQYRFMDIDYSFSNLSDEGALPPGHRFSVTFNLGKTREEKIILAEEERLRRERELVERTKEEDRQGRIVDGMQKGQEFLKDDRFFDAYSEYQKVITDDPFNKQAQAGLDSANALIEKQFNRRQQEAISQAVDAELAIEDQRYIELHFEKGKLFLEKKQYNDALKEFNLALERRPDDEIIEEALRTTQRRLNGEVRTLVSQARQEFTQANFSDALRLLSEALILAPESPELKEEINILANRIKIQEYVQQGLAMFDTGDYQAALGVFEEALKLDPSNEAIRQYIERSRRGLGGTTGPDKMEPADEVVYRSGTALFLKGRYEEAAEIWRGLAEKYPSNEKLQNAIKTVEDRIKRTRENQ
ncbi:MAG: PorV/PorQ family protein [Calditrichia bacterium]